MSALSNRFNKTALRLVERFGASYTLKRTVPGTINPAHPSWAVADSVEEYPCKAAVTAFKAYEVNGTSILQGDRRVVLALTEGLPAEIRLGDAFMDKGIEWRLVGEVEQVEVNGVVVAYNLQIRRA